MRAALDGILRRMITAGRLTVTWPDGSHTVYAGEPGPSADCRIRDQKTIRRLLSNPALTTGEAYMAGRLTVEHGTLYDLLDLILLNIRNNPGSHPVLRLRETLAAIARRLRRYTPIRPSPRRVAHQYDLTNRLYNLFLDRDRQYSCAYFVRGDETLEQAQTAKKRHVAAKLCLDRPGLRVLDIGCGWGGMALTLARDFGAQVTGITLSQDQLNVARTRAAAEGLAGRVRFEHLDYRYITETFDRIVSIATSEHVTDRQYGTFFETISRCLESDGVALVEAVGRGDRPGRTHPWLRKHIAPNAYAPALSEVLPWIEQSALKTTDIEIMRLHYAETLRNWRRRFAANRDAIAALYDERFCRMFEFFLAASEIAFRRRTYMVWQAQLTHAHAAVPLTRDYIAAFEAGEPVGPMAEATSPLRR